MNKAKTDKQGSSADAVTGVVCAIHERKLAFRKISKVRKAVQPDYEQNQPY